MGKIPSADTDRHPLFSSLFLMRTACFPILVSQWMARRGIHFAWVIVAITFLTALTSSAALGLPGALMQPSLSREFGWDAEQISSALAVRFVLFGLMGPFAAILMERFGLRSHLRGAGPDRCRHAAGHAHDAVLAPGGPVGHPAGAGFGHDGAGLECRGGEPLVRDAPGPGGRRADGQAGHGPSCCSCPWAPG